jgi:hypothetical protein
MLVTLIAKLPDHEIGGQVVAASVLDAAKHLVDRWSRGGVLYPARAATGPRRPSVSRGSAPGHFA